MPPPPPPSASYLLVLDTDESSQEEEQEERIQHHSRPQAVVPVVVPTLPSVCPLKENTSVEDIHGDNDRIRQDESTAIATVESPNNKKKKKRKKKRKKKTPKKSVTFGTVSIRHHERALGQDVIPLDGAWPLGLMDTIVHDSSIDLEEFEQARQAKLRQRHAKLHPDAQVPVVLETRQYDYKKKVKDQPHTHKNPLFGMLKEEERMALLLRSSSSDLDDTQQTQPPQAPHSPSNTRTMTRRLRSHSNADKYEYNDVYTCTDVLHVRNELEQVRNFRGLEHLGCACHKKHKKKRHKKMTERKVKEELRKRNKLPKSFRDKHELFALLEQVIQDEPCCWGEDCPCVKNGIHCHADVCSCWRQCNDNKTMQDLQDVCGNKHGFYIVDTPKINAIRELYLCQPILDNGVKATNAKQDDE